MTTADDHWPATLERVVSSLDFEMANDDPVAPQIRSKAKGDTRQLPALVSLAVQAALEVDKRVGAGDTGAPVDRKAILSRKDLVRALSATAHGGTHGMFIAGYAAAYRLELARILWAGIADAPRRRLEELAGVKPSA